MVFGMTTFKCDECGNRFEALAAEMGPSCILSPMPCTKCGSYHTMPAPMFSQSGRLNPLRALYQEIWAVMDKKKR